MQCTVYNGLTGDSISPRYLGSHRSTVVGLRKSPSHRYGSACAVASGIHAPQYDGERGAEKDVQAHIMCAHIMSVCKHNVCVQTPCLCANIVSVCKHHVCVQTSCLCANTLSVCIHHVCVQTPCLCAYIMSVCKQHVCVHTSCLRANIVSVCKHPLFAFWP